MVVWKVKGLYKADAEKVYSEITALGDSFSPDQIVEAAKDEKSELHKCFDWNDTCMAGTAMCRSAHLSQHFQSRRSSSCLIWPVHSSVSAREEAKAMADSMLRR